jgi:hypothetical protein
MVLEKKIVFVGNSTNTPEDSTAHEVVGIGAKPVNDLESLSQNKFLQSSENIKAYIMIIPEVQLGYSAIGACKRLCAVPMKLATS